MNGHDTIRKVLPLAAAGGLDAAEMRHVQQHLAICEECRRMTEDYALLVGAFRSLPMPQPSAELVAKVRRMAASELERHRRGVRDAAALAPAVAASWIAALATWPWLRAAGSWVIGGWHWPGGSIAHALALYSILGLCLSSVAAIAIGVHARAIGRMR